MKCFNCNYLNKKPGICVICNHQMSVEVVKKPYKIPKSKPGKEVKKIAKFSTKNTYQTSTGERFTKVQVESKVRKAKTEKLKQMVDIYGYVFCEQKDDKCDGMLDCSHDLGVSDCQKQSKTELAWNVKNITILCRHHHQIRDRLILKGSKVKL